MTQDVQDLDIMELQHGKYFGKSLQKDNKNESEFIPCLQAFPLII